MAQTNELKELILIRQALSGGQPSSPLVQSLLSRVDQLEINSQPVAITLNLPADVWTDFALISDASEFQVLDVSGNNLTDSFEYRQFQGKWQIQSLTIQNNLQIILKK